MRRSLWILSSSIVLLAGCGNDIDANNAAKRNYSNLKIAAPPNGGIYIGQNEWNGGDDVPTFEAAIGRRVAMVSDEAMVFVEDEQGNVILDFDVEAAERAWQRGQVVLVHAMEATPAIPETGKLTGFTVDKLLMGAYEEDLKRLAEKYRQFGKPMFFNTAREPNGILVEHMGGFGPDGDKSHSWAEQNQRFSDEFDPSAFPNPELYSDLGDPAVCDGVERLVAAQRYYHDFFVRREGLGFLTFDLMMWAVDPLGDPNYARGSCFDFNSVYPGDDYVDWFSINWYLGLSGDDGQGLPIDSYLDSLGSMVEKFRQLAPDKPVFIMELGFLGGPANDPSHAAQNVTDGLTALVTTPEINGFAMWSMGDGLVRPNTPQSEAFKKVIEGNPTQFHSCVYLSDGQRIPNCEDGP